MSNETLVSQAIEATNISQVAFSKFITANDAGVTGGHQSGFHLHKNSYPLYFNKPGQKGSNKDKTVKIKWHDDFETESRFIYYGVGTRDEYRLTRFGRGFPLLNEDSVGNLLILCKMNEEEYKGYVLTTDDDIEDFLSAFGLSPTETNRLIPKTSEKVSEGTLEELFIEYISSLSVEFPQTLEVAENARRILMEYKNLGVPDIQKSPDKEILRWLDTEYQLFKAIENDRYSEIISKPFKDVDTFVQTANSVLNRRKSRAGKSLEHHLGFMFTTFNLKFTEQPVTEGNKKPDFIFPGEDEYHNFEFDKNKLVFLGAKTTCKDRWRQVINEADRIDVKYLFTLQQGISSNQLKEMDEHKVKLVVPKEYIKAYPPEHQQGISSLDNFIRYVEETQR
ncbi:MAG: restriction endonuclease [Candidatus Delongbacteria bacterium]|nr:restriction endonuclease [Candidatus Delongbacteria bacterium]